MIDPATASSLRALFAAKTGQYPFLSREAEIVLETHGGLKCQFRADTPAETARLLQHIVNNEADIFNRDNKLDNGTKPLHFRMYKHVILALDKKEACTLAFNFSFRESNQPSSIWLSNPEMDDYHWKGEERIENKPPYTSVGPTLKETIATLRKAGDDWTAVNFLSEPKGHPTLKLVQPRP